MKTDNNLQGGLIDKKATIETKCLYMNLKEISKRQILYGHQDDLAYGVNWWAKEGRSDVKEVCGSYPAVFGWELGNLENPRNQDSVLYADIKDWIIKVYQMGGINTISWRVPNPSGISANGESLKPVQTVLPGGEKHEYYKKQLKLFAQFNSKLINPKGVQVPLIFRTLHEQNGNWYWWGKKFCTIDEYSNLFRFTVKYLRDSLDIHNLIYVYSPDGQFDDYIDRYPGDDYVDILGLNYYFREEITEKVIINFTQKLEEISNLAESKKKMAALIETGYESMPDPMWHTKALLNPIKKCKDKIKLVYMLTWKNADKNHCFAPYRGHLSSIDFNCFYKDSMTVFLNDLPDVYTSKK